MNTKIRTSLIGLTAVLLVSITVFTSCKKEVIIEETPVIKSAELPIENLTIYSGPLAYTSISGSNIQTANGSASVIKVGDTYTIDFSDNVPSVSDLKFKGSGGGFLTISVDSSVAGISIDSNIIAIAIAQDGNNWGFSGEY